MVEKKLNNFKSKLSQNCSCSLLDILELLAWFSHCLAASSFVPACLRSPPLGRLLFSPVAAVDILRPHQTIHQQQFANQPRTWTQTTTTGSLFHSDTFPTWIQWRLAATRGKWTFQEIL